MKNDDNKTKNEKHTKKLRKKYIKTVPQIEHAGVQNGNGAMQRWERGVKKNK